MSGLVHAGSVSLSNIRAALVRAEDHTPQFARICPSARHGRRSPCARLHDKGDATMKLGSGPLLKGLMVALVALIVLASGADAARVDRRTCTSATGSGCERVLADGAGNSSLGGPILAIPVTVTPDGSRALRRRHRLVRVAGSLTLESELKVLDERRKLGVYEVPVYVANVHAVSHVQHRVAHRGAHAIAARRGRCISIGRASSFRCRTRVALREIHLTGAGVADRPFEPDAGFAIKALSIALRPDAQIEKGSHQFDLTLQVAGTHSLSFMPTSRARRARAVGELGGSGVHPRLPVRSIAA